MRGTSWNTNYFFPLPVSCFRAINKQDLLFLVVPFHCFSVKVLSANLFVCLGFVCFLTSVIFKLCVLGSVGIIYRKLHLMGMEVEVHITAEKAGPALLETETDLFVVSCCSRKHWKRNTISNDGIGNCFSN